MPAGAAAPAVVAPAAAPQATTAPAADAPAAAAVPAAVATVPQSAQPEPDSAPRAGSVATEPRELTKDELDKLDYRGNFFGTTYRVKVFNGNEDLRLTEVTIAVWDKDDIDRLETYRTAVDIQPLDEGTAKYTVVYDGQEETWAWKLVGAKGAQ